MFIEVWADGASCGNSKGPGGWCSLVKVDGEVKHTAYGGDTKTTNNVMELQAVIGGLESVIVMLSLRRSVSGHQIKIISDSNYIIGAFNEGWIVKWISNGWRKSVHSNILRPNSDVWNKLVGVVSYLETMGNEIQWQHVNGHVGIPENEYCDKIAKQEKQKQKLILAGPIYGGDCNEQIANYSN